MGQETKIQWCDHTFNPWRGCTKISDGCTHCYADAQAKRNPGVLGIWGDNGTRVFASEAKWKEPLKWNKEARKAGERRRVFCASMADVFEDWKGSLVDSAGGHPWPGVMSLDRVRRHLIELMWDTPHLDWLLLTKRIENAERMLYEMGFPDAEWPKNYWLGTTVENQEQADKRTPILLKTPAPIRWLSMEPLLGPVDLSSYLKQPWMPDQIVKPGSVPVEYMPVVGLDWVIVGGESGSKARPCNLEWIRSIVEQCRKASVPVFVKQLGSKPRDPVRGPEFGLPDGVTSSTHYWDMKLKDGHGGDPGEWPEDLRIREFPVLEPA